MRWACASLPLFVCLLSLVATACGGDTTSPAPSPAQHTAIATPTPEPTPTESTPSPTPAATMSATPEPTPTPDAIESTPVPRDAESDSQEPADSGVRTEPQVMLAVLTVTSGTTAQPIWPAFSSNVGSYTVPVINTVTRITIEGTPAGEDDALVAYQDADGTVIADVDMDIPGQQVDLPSVGGKRINVVVTRGPATRTYAVLVVRAGLAGAEAPCSTGAQSGSVGPVPTPVDVTAVPIVVESTTDEYFVLYVQDETDAALWRPVSPDAG